MTTAFAVLLRVAALALLTFVYVQVLDRSESADPLGAGLLFFLIAAGVCGVWALVDGARRGLAVSVVVWTVVAAVCGVAINAVVLWTMDTSDGRGWAFGPGDVLFFALLVLVPAVLGAALGGLGRRLGAAR